MSESKIDRSNDKLGIQNSRSKMLNNKVNTKNYIIYDSSIPSYTSFMGCGS